MADADIPDDWLTDIVPREWRPIGSHFSYANSRTGEAVEIITLTSIEPPVRDPGIPYFCKDRLRSLAAGMVKGDRIRPEE